jgi:hypothetical protein
VRNNEGEPWYNNNMQGSDLPTLPEDNKEYRYVLSTTNPGCEIVRDYLLTSGEIVKGIGTMFKSLVVTWVRSDGDIYLGVGVEHV